MNEQIKHIAQLEEGYAGNLGNENVQKMKLRFGRLSHEFNVPVDSYLLYLGMQEALDIARETFPGNQIRLLDLGCNSFASNLLLLKRELIDEAAGIEINEGAVQKAKKIAGLLGIDKGKYHLLNSDIQTDESLVFAKKFSPTIIAANLPYLPALKEAGLVAVNGGIDGTRFVPGLVLQYGCETHASILTLNMSSLTSPEKVLNEIEGNDYGLEKVLIFAHPFGKYTSELVEQGLIPQEAFNFFYMKNKIYRQCVINLILKDRKLGQPKVLKNELLDLLRGFSLTGELSNIS